MVKPLRMRTRDARDTAPYEPRKQSHLRFGQYLIEHGVITSDQLLVALREQSQNKGLLGETLVGLGLVDDISHAMALASYAGLEYLDLTHGDIDFTLFRRFPHPLASKHRAVPISLRNGTLCIAMQDPFDIIAVDEIRKAFGYDTTVEIRVVQPSTIQEVLSSIDRHVPTIDDLIESADSGHTGGKVHNLTLPVIEMVDLVLKEAVERGASDIHLEPEDSYARIRYRIDGVLIQARALHLSYWPALLQRVKIMSGMNIAESRSIQDGRFQQEFSGHDVDFRVAVMPTVWGETVSIRILDHRRSLLPLDELGYSAHNLNVLRRIIKRPYGITIFAGPTGSGKTTTLYSILQELNSVDVHIATLEEPVEYQLSLIRQTQIQEGQSVDFSSGIRGLLRMDPDIIFVGEIRDADTAQMALRAAMTGHQVFSTVHCNDVFGIVPRLIDLGLSERALSGNLTGLVSQRLVRKLCPHCKKLIRASDEQKRQMNISDAGMTEIAVPVGCIHCAYTGRKGRIVISEALGVSHEMGDILVGNSSRHDQLGQALSEGFVPLQQDGLARVLAHEVSLDDLEKEVDLHLSHDIVEG